MQPRVPGWIGAAYAIGVGLAIIGLWMTLLMGGNVPELESATLEIGYHLVAELLTAGLLLAAGIGLLLRRPWARRLYPVALGMLGYTVINSAGYYAQLGAFDVVGMFTVLTIATVILVISFVTGRGRTGEPTRVAIPGDIDA